MVTKVDIAVITHEANRAYCLALGDDSQPHWDDAPQWQKDSAIAGVTYFFEHFNSKNGVYPEPAEMHDSWLVQKTKDGWTYGEVKDADKKTHPCMLPYSQLPEEQRQKDVLFQSICLAFCRGIVTVEN